MAQGSLGSILSFCPIMSRLESIPIFAEQAVGLEDFRAVYDVVQCVCFRPRKGEVEIKSNETKNVERKRKRRDSSLSSSLSLPLPDDHRAVLEVIRETYESASPRDQESWNVEDDGKGNRLCSRSPYEFLSSTIKSGRSSNSNSGSNENGGNKKGEDNHKSNANTDGYCSFVLQDDSNNAVSSFTKRMENLVAKRGGTTNPSTRKMLPYSLLLANTNSAFADYEENDVTHTEKGSRKKMIPPLFTMDPHYWIFVGRNKHCESGEWLSGRKEHTDSIEHDGTFHYQLLGKKLWNLRPTLELRERCDRDHDMTLLDNYEVLVEEGDVFVINTKLWWHQTEIPPGWSVSYARDLYLEGKEAGVISDGTTNRESDKHHWDEYGGGGYGDESDLETDVTYLPGQKSVGNVEISWASAFIQRGTTLVVDDVIDNNEDGDHCTDGDEYKHDTVSSLYHHLVPPTIGRTSLASKANCKLVLLSTEPGSDGHTLDSEQGDEETTKKDTSSKASARQKPRLRQIALEMIRDIREGEEFVMLFKKRNV